MSHELFDTLAPVYAVGTLDGDDLVGFEAHLREGCETCETVLRESAEALTALGRDATPVIPPAHVREALLRRAQTSPRPRRFRWMRWANSESSPAIFRRSMDALRAVLLTS